MINLDNLDGKTKATIVCLFYAKLKSDDNRYKVNCYSDLKLLSEKFAIKYKTLTNYKDIFDAQFDNGRKGWYQRPLENQGEFLRDFFVRFKDLPVSELSNLVDRIMQIAKIEDNYFSIKTKDLKTVENILSNKKIIEFDGLNVLKDSIKLGQIVFIVLGGDKPLWETGLIGLGLISRIPYEEGYDTQKLKNFKVEVDIKILLKKPIKREDLVPYMNTYGIIGIAPIIKWEPNQAVSQIAEKNAIALMRAMLELNPEIEDDLASIVTSEIMTRIKGVTTKMLPVEIDYEEYLAEKIVKEQEVFPYNSDFYSKVEFLHEVFIEEEAYDSMVSLLEYKKNLILEGAPGVGKTYAATRLAYSILGCKDFDRVKIVQFHQSYSYEDFVVGFRPTSLGFELSAGPFLDFCIKATKDRRKHFFIIDEINRGNLSKIFGELLMLIESDKRHEKITLLYKNEEFSVPENVYIIGMMNSADRSLAIIDYALRRRFSFYQMFPAFNSKGFKRNIEAVQSDRFTRIIRVMNELNEFICDDDSLGEGYQIGHSYFCMKEKISDSLLKLIVNYEIIPILKEYWFDDKEKIEKWISRLLGVLND